MSLKETILSNRPREISGSTASSRFDYQKDWSICQLIEHHRISSDYLFLFDYHEDLVIMNSESSPTKISFYQLKGKKSGNWTLNHLLDSDSGKDGTMLLSIIGKLYDCKSKFSMETQTLNFVSNARYNVKLEDGTDGKTKDQICIIELREGDRTKIKEKLIKELSLASDPDYESLSFLKVTELSLNDSSAHTKGKLSDFFEEIKPNGKFAIPALYQNLFSEVKRRSAYNKEIHSFEELIEKKGISRSNLQNWLDNAGVCKDYDELWKSIEISIISERMPLLERRKLKSSWTDFELAIKDPNNTVVKQLRAQIHDISKSLEQSGELGTLTTLEVLTKVFNNYQQNKINQNVYDEYFIKVLILAEINQ